MENNSKKIIPKNVKAAEKLIKRYRSITLSEIKENVAINAEGVFNARGTAYTLTKFGHATKCTLCAAVSCCCSKCIYGDNDDFYNDCTCGENGKTYNDIDNAKTPLKLRNAFRKRADHIEKKLSKILIIK